AERVRARAISPVALAETFLERLDTLGPKYNAVVTVTRERAMAEARRAEWEIAAGRYRGLLHGIPYGAKDLLATSGGIPTTWGSILSPAGYCGIAGLRPSYGRVSRHGAMAICWTLDKLGPLCLTADDCGLVLEAIAGADPADPSTSDRPWRFEDGALDGRQF